MDAFIQRHPQDVIGVVNGFDRLRFRGMLRSICYAAGLDLFLARVGVQYKDFKEVASSWSARLLEQAQQVAQQAGRPFQYVASSNEDKQAEVQRIAQRDGITEGLVCVLRCVESCKSFAIRRNGKGGFRFRPEERPASVLLLYGSRVRADARARGDLVALWDSGLSQWSRVSGPADEQGRDWL